MAETTTDISGSVFFYLQDLAHRGSTKFIPMFNSFLSDLDDSDKKELLQTWLDERKNNNKRTNSESGKK
tara:strand:+ start:2413 stop:2619 length:207 start_codon:yes stop_codon:yes gene_type:complete